MNEETDFDLYYNAEKIGRMNVWVSFLGFSPIAVINCIWCAIKRDSFIPDKVVLIATKSAKANFEPYKKMLFTLISFYNTSVDEQTFLEIVEISDTSSYTEMSNVLSDIIQKYKQQSASIAVDITPGRKIMSVIATFVAMQYRVDRIYYLFLVGEKEYKDKLYGEIPCIHNRLYMIWSSDPNAGHFIQELGCDKDAFPAH